MKVLKASKFQLEDFSDTDLFSLRVDIEKEFKKRGIQFSVGEIGETLAIQFFQKNSGIGKLLRAARGTKDADAYSRNAERYTIKTIKSGVKTGTIYPDENDTKRQLFDYLLIVILDDNFEMESLYRFTWDQFISIRAWDKRMNAWYVPKTIKGLKVGECLYDKGKREKN